MSEEMNRQIIVGVDLDTEKADKKYDKLKKNAEQTTVNMPIDFNLDSLKETLGKIESELNKIGKKFGKEIDFSKSQKDLKNLLEEFEKVQYRSEKTGKSYLKVLGIETLIENTKTLVSSFESLNKTKIDNSSIDRLSDSLKEIVDLLSIIQSSTALERIRPSTVVKKEIEEVTSELEKLSKERDKIQNLEKYFNKNRDVKGFVQSLFDGEELKEDENYLDKFAKKLGDFIKLGGDLSKIAIPYRDINNEDKKTLATLEEIYNKLIAIGAIEPFSNLNTSNAYKRIKELELKYNGSGEQVAGTLAKELEQSLEKEKFKIGVSIDTESLAQMSEQIANSLQKVNLVFEKMPDSINFGIPEGDLLRIVSSIEAVTDAINNLRASIDSSSEVLPSKGKTNTEVKVEVDSPEFVKQIKEKISEESVAVNVHPTVNVNDFIDSIQEQIKNKDVDVSVIPILGDDENNKGNTTESTVKISVSENTKHELEDIKDNLRMIKEYINDIQQLGDIELPISSEIDKMSNIIEKQLLNKTPVNEWAENFRKQLDSISSKFERLFGENPLVAINNGYSQADYAQILFGKGKESLRERGFLYNSTTHQMTSPYKFDQPNSIARNLKAEITLKGLDDELKNLGYDTSWHSHPELNSVMSTIVKGENNQYSGDLFTWLNSKRMGIKTEINSSILDTTVFDSFNFYEKYGDIIENFLKASEQEKQRIYNIKQKYFHNNAGKGEGTWNSWLDSFVQKYGDTDLSNKNVIDNLEKVLPKTSNKTVNESYQKAIDIIRNYYSDKGPQEFFEDIYAAAQKTGKINNLDKEAILPAVEKIEKMMELTSEEKNALSRLKNIFNNYAGPGQGSLYFEKAFGFQEGLLSKGPNKTLRSYGMQQLMPEMMKEAFGIEDFADYFKVYTKKEFEELNLFGNNNQIPKFFDTSLLDKFNELLEKIAQNLINISTILSNLNFGSISSDISSLTSLSDDTKHQISNLKEEEIAADNARIAEEKLYETQKEENINPQSTLKSNSISVEMQKEQEIVERVINSEKESLSSLSQIIENKIIPSIEEKTNAFKEEEQVVIGTVNREVTELTILAGFVENVISSIRELKQKIDDLPPITLNVDIGDLKNIDSSTGKIIEDIQASITGIQVPDISQLSEQLTSIGNKDTISKNIQKIANALLNLKSNINNVGNGGNQFLQDVKELVAQKDSLENLAKILSSSIQKIEAAKKTVDESLSTNSNLSNEDNITDEAKAWEQLAGNILESQKVQKTKMMTDKENEAILNSLAQAQQEVAESIEKTNEAQKETSSKVDNKMLDSTSDSLGKWSEKLSELSKLNKYVDDFKNEIASLQDKINKFDLTKLVDPNLSENAKKEFDEIEQAYNNLVSETKNPENLIANVDTISKLRTKVAKVLMENTAMPKDLQEQFKNLQDRLQALADSGQANKKATAEQVTEYNKLVAAMNESGKVGLSWWDQLKKRIESINKSFISMYLSLYDVIRYTRQMATTVINIDSAITELRKVSNATDVELNGALKEATATAKELGSSISDVVNIQADWSRLGYTVQEAEELARVTTLFKTIGDNMDATTASQYMVSTLQGFQKSADEALDIVDKYNEVA